MTSTCIFFHGSMIRFTRLFCGKSICKSMRDHNPPLILDKKEILSSPGVCFVSLKFCQPTIKRLITKTTLRHKHKLSGSRFTQHRSISLTNCCHTWKTNKLLVSLDCCVPICKRKQTKQEPMPRVGHSCIR